MTEIVEDNVNVRLQIGIPGKSTVPTVQNSFEDNALFWDVVEMKVELSQANSPNYAKGKVVPKKENIETIRNIIDDGISNLVGSHFRLEAINNFVAVKADESDNQTRNSFNPTEENENKDSLLFNGRLANISPVGTNLYEITAYDPGQQAFNKSKNSGSLINQKLDLTGVENSEGTTVIEEPPEDRNNVVNDITVPVTNLIETIVKEAGIKDNAEILKEDFKVVNSTPLNAAEIRRVQSLLSPGSPGANISPSDEVKVSFSKLVVNVEEALERVREQTNTEYWFDKDGTFYFGSPTNESIGTGASQVFEVTLIKDTSAGITTPPYQSVRVISPGLSSTSGSRTSQQFIADDEEKLVVKANIAEADNGEVPADEIIVLDPDNIQEPTFKYINAELTTDEQAQNTALKIANDLIKQQANGTVTLVGMPEIQIFDGILMPQNDKQPMGGQLYGVNKVIHKLNGSDGFITEVSVAGPTPKIRATVDPDGFDSVSNSPLDDTTAITPGGASTASGDGTIINQDLDNDGVPDAEDEFPFIPNNE